MNPALAQLLVEPRLQLASGETLRAKAGPSAGGFPVAAGSVQEWFLTGDFPDGVWYPPLTIMASLAARHAAHGRMVWIGRRCWPTFQLLGALGQAEIFSRSLFLDPLTDAERFWAIDQALRCSGISAVIADGGGMSHTISRRLQLAAESGRGLALIARPPREIEEPSCAVARWDVTPRKNSRHQATWDIRLLSCRGQLRGQDAAHLWAADWSYQVHRGSGALDLFAGMGRGAVTPSVGGAQARSRTA